MLNGILITIGVILVIASRFLYGTFDIRLGGDDKNNFIGGLALIFDIVGTILIVYSLLDQWR